MQQLLLRQPIHGTVALTGASGFIGSQLRAALLASGADVISLVRPDSPPVKLGRAAAVDYGDEATLRRVFEQEQPDYVFHVAGATKGVSEQDFWRGNVLPTQSLVRALNAAHPALRRFVLVSSLTAYGPSNDGRPLSESDAPRPIEFYGQSKLQAERVLTSEAGKLPWTIVRPSGVYGPADVDSFVLFRAAKLRINLFYGNRKKRASMVYVDDLVRALVDSAQAESTLRKGYFIGDGVAYTWDEIQAHVARAVGKRGLRVDLPSFVVPLAARAGELITALDKQPRILNRQKALMDAQAAWLCSSDAARRDFGFAAQVDMAEGTRRAYAWYTQQGWL
jgi:nucleoside-diphosphate-sugar epimerase